MEIKAVERGKRKKRAQKKDSIRERIADKRVSRDKKIYTVGQTRD